MIYPEPRLQHAGEAALVVEFAEEVVPEANDAVLALDVALTAVAVAGICMAARLGCCRDFAWCR